VGDKIGEGSVEPPERLSRIEGWKVGSIHGMLSVGGGGMIEGVSNSCSATPAR